MASRRKRSSSRSRQGGSTLYGLLVGLLLGLIVAAAVAFYVTQAPMPFTDRATRDVAPRPAPNPRNAPDPNRGLTGQNAPGGTPTTGPTATAVAPLPGAGSAAPSVPSPPKEDLDSLIAALGSSTPPAPTAPTAPPEQSVQSDAAYFLQVGAFRVVEDADALRAQVLLMGLPVEIQRAEVNGALLNRVRVGPYRRLDDMNRARALLGQEKIVATVVRQ